MRAALCTDPPPAPEAPTSISATAMAAHKLRIPLSCTSPPLGSLRDASIAPPAAVRHELTRRSMRFLERIVRLQGDYVSIAPSRMPQPCVEALDRQLELGLRQAERFGVGDLFDLGGRVTSGECVEHVTHRQAVRDDQRGVLWAREELAIPVDVAGDGLHAALAA